MLCARCEVALGCHDAECMKFAVTEELSEEDGEEETSEAEDIS